MTLRGVGGEGPFRANMLGKSEIFVRIHYDIIDVGQQSIIWLDCNGC